MRSPSEAVLEGGGCVLCLQLKSVYSLSLLCQVSTHSPTKSACLFLPTVPMMQHYFTAGSDLTSFKESNYINCVYCRNSCSSKNFCTTKPNTSVYSPVNCRTTKTLQPLVQMKKLQRISTRPL